METENPSNESVGGQEKEVEKVKMNDIYVVAEFVLDVFVVK